MKCSLLCGVNTSIALSIRGWISDSSRFSSLRPKNISFPNFSPRSTHTPERFRVGLSCQIDEFMIDLALKSDDIQPLLQKELWSFEWFSKSPFVRSFLFCQEVLNISQIAIALHRISPPFFIHASWQQYSRRSFFILRTALSDENSLQDLPNSNDLSV